MARANRPYHVTSPDRLGLALASGGVMAGTLAGVLAWIGGTREVGAIGAVTVAGGGLAMIAIVALFGPVWLVLHRIGRRGPLIAAGVAAVTMFAALTIALTAWGAAAGGAQWLLAASAAAPPAIAAAAIAAVMQRIAYRRLL